MSTEIKVPTLGESVSTATVARWLKKVGEAVKADEPLVELETDKVTVEVNAPTAGVMESIAAAEGAEVTPGTVLGAIAAGAVAARPAAPALPVPAPAAAAPVQPQLEPHRAVTGPVAVPGHAPLPAAARMMAEAGVSAGQVGAGTAKDGRISKGDVLDFLARPAATPAAAAAAKAPRALGDGEERVKMTRLRRTIANRLKEAQNTAAMLTTFNEVDMSGLMEMRRAFGEAFLAAHGVKLGFMSAFVKAAADALEAVPAVNAVIDGSEIVYRDYTDISIAVATPKGLVVPVLRNADALSFAGVERGIADLGKKARDGTISVDDMAGGTFTISNGGVYGSLLSTPIINPPQSAILGMHSIVQRPVVVPGGAIEARPMMNIALTYDHRLIDGREAVTFLKRVKDVVEDPRRLLLDC